MDKAHCKLYNQSKTCGPAGRPNDPANAIGQAASLHAIGTRIVVVAVDKTFDDVNLNALASGPQHVQQVPDVTALTAVVGNVIKEACGGNSGAHLCLYCVGCTLHLRQSKNDGVQNIVHKNKAIINRFS